MVQLSIKENKDLNKAELTLSGELTLDAVPEIQSKLSSASDKFAEIHLFITEVEQIDMSGIQLLLALEKKMTANRKVIQFSFNLDKDKSELLSKAGFSYLIKN